MRAGIRLDRFWRRAWFSAAAFTAVVAAFGGCVEQDEDVPTEDDKKAIQANLLTAPPSPRFPVNADIDGKVIYLGADVTPTEVEPGKDLKVTHYWKSVASVSDGWRVFTHVEGPRGANYINADHGPVGGKYPVTQWKPGEIIRDEQTIKVPAGWSHPQLVVYTGVWKGTARLPVKSGASDGANRVIAVTLPMKVAPKAEPPRKRYTARRTGKPIKIDGKLDEQAWKDAPSTGWFADTMTGAPVEQRTEAKLLWDDKFLYVAFENADTDIWSHLTKRDDKLWTQEADELMIDANGDGRGYVELQVAPTGALFDTYLPEYRKYEDSIDPKKKQFSWNSKTNVKVSVDGTLNKHGDTDKSWTAELAIPLEDVKGMDATAELPKLPPALGNLWRINMFRMDNPQEKGQKAFGWSPPLVGDFHKLDRFGELVFADEHGDVTAPRPLPVVAKADVPEGKGDAKAEAKAAKLAKGGKGGAGGKSKSRTAAPQ